MKVDFGKTADDYSRHRAGFPDSFFERLDQWGIGNPGQRIVDLGTGTGTLARGFAKRGCQVIGIDPAEAMLIEARKLAKAARVEVKYRVGRAENTGLPDNSVDVVTAGQCWHWFDRPAAAKEAMRVVRAGGMMVIAHFDWVPLAGNVVFETEALILKYNPVWDMAGGNGLYPLWLEDLALAGFQDLETFSYDVFVPYTHEAWRGRIRASAGIGASLLPEEVEVFDRHHAQTLHERFPDAVLQVHHRVFALIASTP